MWLPFFDLGYYPDKLVSVLVLTLPSGVHLENTKFPLEAVSC